MAENIKSPQNGELVDFSLIIDVLRDQWRIFGVVLLISFIVGVVAYFLIPSRWQADATLRVGEIVSIASGEPSTELIEPVGEAVARMQLTQFQNAVINSPALQNLEPSEIVLFKKTFKAVLVKGTYFIRVSVSGRSPQTAREMLEVAIETLSIAHQEKMRPAIQQMRNRIENLNARIILKQKSLERLRQILERKKGTEDTVRALDLLDRQETEIQQLMDERSVMESMLRPPQTFNTAIEDAVKVGSKPYFPRLSIFLIASILIGGLLGILTSLCLYRKKRQLQT